MRSFTIAFEGDGHDDGRQIEFEADDPARAFFILEREGVGKRATLLEGDRRLGILKRAHTGYWQFLP
jgi:hypothetical protein